MPVFSSYSFGTKEASPPKLSTRFKQLFAKSPQKMGEQLLAELNKPSGKCSIQKCLSLINAGASLEGRDDAGKTPLICAAGSGYKAVVKALIDNGANLNSWGSYATGSAMNLAAHNGQTEIVGILIKAGAQLVDDKVALQWIARFGYPHIVEMIAAAKASGAPVAPQKVNFGILGYPGAR